MPDGTLVARDRGTPQGGVVSPVLSNLFLHYVFDEWMRKHRPEVRFERYADDILVHCGSEAQALMLREVIEQRLAECRLRLHPDKTRIVHCKNSQRPGNYPNQGFDFLGYGFGGVSSRNLDLAVGERRMERCIWSSALLSARRPPNASARLSVIGPSLGGQNALWRRSLSGSIGHYEAGSTTTGGIGGHGCTMSSSIWRKLYCGGPVRNSHAWGAVFSGRQDGCGAFGVKPQSSLLIGRCLRLAPAGRDEP